MELEAHGDLPDPSSGIAGGDTIIRRDEDEGVKGEGEGGAVGEPSFSLHLFSEGGMLFSVNGRRR